MTLKLGVASQLFLEENFRNTKHNYTSSMLQQVDIPNPLILTQNHLRRRPGPLPLPLPLVPRILVWFAKAHPQKCRQQYEGQAHKKCYHYCADHRAIATDFLIAPVPNNSSLAR